MTFYYHATNLDNALDIATSGSLVPHGPGYGTDQSVWPDGSREKRSYFGRTPDSVQWFYPEEGRPLLLRVPADAVKFKEERGTRDIVTTQRISVDVIECRTDAGEWILLRALLEARSRQNPSVKLTAAQVAALRAIAACQEEWCWTSIRVSTLYALRDRGLIETTVSESYRYYRTRSGSSRTGKNKAAAHFTSDLGAKLTALGREFLVSLK